MFSKYPVINDILWCAGREGLHSKLRLSHQVKKMAYSMEMSDEEIQKLRCQSAFGKVTGPYWGNALISPSALSLHNMDVLPLANRRGSALAGSSFPRKSEKILALDRSRD